MMNEMLKDDLILDTPMNNNMMEKSPCGLDRINKEESPLFFNKSQTLDNYLLPNKENTNSQTHFSNNSDNEVELNFPMKNVRNNFNLEKALENMTINNDNEEEESYQEEFDDQMEIEPYENEDSYIPMEVEEEINIEDFYNEDNLLLIDGNFQNRNHFAIFILTNKLRQIYFNKGFGNDNSLLYMITPLFKNTNDYYEQLEIQKDLTEIKNSAYNNFIYFPYNLVLINLLTMEDEDNES
jgi:hypothetical protein